MGVRSSLHARVVVAGLAGLVPFCGPTPAQAADPAHDPVAKCDLTQQRSGYLVFAGVATAPLGHAAPTSMTIRCTYSDAISRHISLGWSPSSVVTTFGVVPHLAGTTTVCATATATYADGHTGTAAETCHIPNLVPKPG